MSMDAALGREIAIDSLIFFACSAERQVATWGMVQQRYRLPRLFGGDSKPATECDYFYGIGCVFKTFLGFIYDDMHSDNATECLHDFNHRLSCMMHTEDEADWSSVAMLNEGAWEKLRGDAKKTLSALGIPLSDAAPLFDVGHLIDPSEFRTSDDVRKLLE